MDVDFNAVRMAAWGLSREFSPVGPGKVAAAAEVLMEVWEEQGLPGLSLLDYDRVSNFLRGLIAGFVFEWNTTRVAPDGRPPSPVSTGLGFDSPPHAADQDGPCRCNVFDNRTPDPPDPFPREEMEGTYHPSAPDYFREG